MIHAPNSSVIKIFDEIRRSGFVEQLYKN
jgi:hypothetical protein